MSIIRAAQLIYTRVEVAYSPQRRKSGFQTVYKSKSLSDAERHAIEKRIQCYRTNQPIGRLQFFTLNSGAIVLTSTTQIKPHLEIIDKDGRRGAFMTHCLILSRAEFDKVDYYPFAIFNHYSFLDDPEEMVARFGEATGIAPLTKIEVERPRHGTSSSWPSTEAQKLVALALQAPRLAKKGQSLLLVGQEEDINEALQTVFSLLPKVKRLSCSFDTYIERCRTQPGLYWAVGTTTRQSNSAYIEVNTTQKRVVSKVPHSLKETKRFVSDLVKRILVC